MIGLRLYLGSLWFISYRGIYTVCRPTDGWVLTIFPTTPNNERENFFFLFCFFTRSWRSLSSSLPFSSHKPHSHSHWERCHCQIEREIRRIGTETQPNSFESSTQATREDQWKREREMTCSRKRTHSPWFIFLAKSRGVSPDCNHNQKERKKERRKEGEIYPHLILYIDVCSSLKKKRHNFNITITRGQVERSRSILEK